MISLHLETTEGIIDGQGKIDERPTFESCAAHGRRQQWFRDWPELINRRVLGDRRYVIEDERTRKTIVIRQQPCGNDEQRDELLSFHKAKRLRNLPIDNHLKLQGVVRTHMRLSTPAYSSVGSLRHAVSRVVTPAACR